MMPVGRIASMASRKLFSGAWAWAKGFWKSARSVRVLFDQAVHVDEPAAPPRSSSERPSFVVARLISSAMPIPAEPCGRNRIVLVFFQLFLRTRSAAEMPATATAAVPWMSSL